MRNPGIAICAAAAVLLMAAPGFSQSGSHQGQGQAVVTVLPNHESEMPSNVTGQDLSVKVNGKLVKGATWTPLQSPANSLELVVLIDGSSRTSLGSQLDDIAHFVNRLPPNTKTAIAYMQNGRAVFAGSLTADHVQVLRALHMPSGSPGSDASPYLCLSDLASHWPSGDRKARREVVMVTDGVDNYDAQFDPEDPYVRASVADSVRAGLVVYAIYWQNQGRAANSAYESNAGQSLLLEVTEATGGKSFWQGTGNPVSFEPFLEELTRRLRNQYELGFVTRLDGKASVESLKLKLSAPGTEVDAPQQVIVFPIASTEK
jgi:hypothetical protein